MINLKSWVHWFNLNDRYLNKQLIDKKFEMLKYGILFLFCIIPYYTVYNLAVP